MANEHDHDHDHHGHDHGHDHGEVVVEFSAKRPAKLKTLDADALILVDGTDGGSFAIASSKKELKTLMKSDADVVYDEKKGKLYLNDNDTAKGWGAKKVGGLLASFKGKPELSTDNFDGLTGFDGATASDAGDIKDQIGALSEKLGDDKMSQLYSETLIDPKKGLKSIAKAGKKEGYKFDKAELGAALDEMNDAGAFSNVEMDASALTTLMGMGGQQEGRNSGGS
ncbi:hypothetical protein [Synechococcus sp. CC9616]|uniref:hypothetical protein n=1 Tax=Synechococcus sp. CC9616 TaxID=110663 RepID=UPI00048DD374|nr:hypothetical protein [Synechococcus sp. CC9616]